AEDGIRDFHVTGVQTCALPIFGVQQADGSLAMEPQARPIFIHDLYRHTSGLMYGGRPDSSSALARLYPDGTAPAVEGDTQAFIRSEERRVGQAWRCRRCPRAVW